MSDAAPETGTTTQAAADEGASGGTNTQRPAEASIAPPGPDSADWRDSIEDPKVREFAARFAGPVELAKGAFELRQKLSGAVALPGEKAGEPEWAAFFKRIGRPDVAEGYTFTLPQGREPTETDIAFQTSMAPILHAAGLNQRQVDVINAGWNEFTQAVEDRRAALNAEVGRKMDESLRRDWGSDYDANVELARRAVREFGGEEFVTRLDEKGLGNDPVLLRFAAEVGRAIGEDRLHIATHGGGAAETAREAKERLMREHFGRDTYRSPEVQQRLDDLNRQIYGSGPIVGDGGRTA